MEDGTAKKLFIKKKIMKGIKKMPTAIFKIAAITLIAMPVLSSCEKSETSINGGEENIITISATSELPDTKTSLGESNVVNWTEGDKITTFWGNSEIAAEFTLSTGEGTTSATFTGTPIYTTDECYAIYPHNSATTISADKTISFTLPATQTYKADGFAEGSNPMVAYKTEAGTLQFKNLCAVLKLQLKVASGTKTIKKITISSATKKLSGAATVAMTYGNEGPVISMASDLTADNYVELTLGDGVELNTTAKAFYIVVPATAAGVSDNSFKVGIESTTGRDVKSAPSSEGNRFNRAKIVSMPSFIYSDAVMPDYIENSNNRGKGVLIGTTIWAPVNCGYDETDYKYGKLYQWGRKDGQGYMKNTFEDATYPSGIQIAEPIAYNTASVADYFYKGTSATSYQWMQKNGSSNAFDATTDWMSLRGEASPHKGNAGIGNPCPAGWRVPTRAELLALIGNDSDKGNWTTKDGQNGRWFDGTTNTDQTTGVFLPAAGYRRDEGSAGFRGGYGYYWSSTPGGDNASYLFFGTGNAFTSSNTRAYGLSVRCVRE
jgi:uncharacterized protein (TIGR02145 family)